MKKIQYAYKIAQNSQFKVQTFYSFIKYLEI